MGGNAADYASGQSVELKRAGAILAAMSGEGEAAGDVLTGAIVAGTIEGTSGKKGPAAHGGQCLNCGATVDGAFCSSCGQRAHLHRSLLHLGHDILHGVFHFEGKLWRTIPELFFHPGRLTRRYIDGERAKFISPMALYLFTVFLMFGVFSFTTSDIFDSSNESVVGDVVEEWKENNQAAKERVQERSAAVREQLAEPNLTPQRRAELEEKLSELQSAQAVMDALAKGDLEAIKELESDEAAKKALDEAKKKADAGVNKKATADLNLGWPALQKRLEHNLKELKDNPSLAFYKLKIASYKYSWALIPLSVPFMWLLFFWRRDIHLYDHAIFITYSISFMMMFLILLTLAAAFGVSGAIWGTALGIVPPLHLYKQLRHAYKLSRFGAWLRLFILSIAISIVLTLFFVLLLMIGLIG